MRRRLAVRRTRLVRPFVLVVSLGAPVLAEPGTHAPTVSTWDTRASSVALSVEPGFVSGGHFDVASYYASFSATNGNLSSQFGIHYLNLRQRSGASVMQGASATAAAVFSRPLGVRYDSGVPELALAPFVGIAPTILVNGGGSIASIPLVLGLGVPWSPLRWLTVAPWVELSPGLSIDTNVHPATIPVANAGVKVVNGAVKLTPADVQRLIDEAVDFRTYFTVGARAGADVAARLSDSVDLGADVAVGSLGSAFNGPFVVWLGARLVFRWDDVVPAVLPAEERLGREACSDVEERSLLCQAARQHARAPSMIVDVPVAAPAPSPSDAFAPAPPRAAASPSPPTPLLVPAAPAPPRAVPEAPKTSAPTAAFPR